MKATYRRVLTTYWTDPDIRRACRTPEAHMVLLYLFTGPDSTLSGLYWQPLEDIAHRTRIELDTVRELIATFCEKGFLAYDHTTEEVFVRAAIQHQVGTEFKGGDRRWRAVMREIADTHSDALVADLVEHYDWVDWPDTVSRRAKGASKGHLSQKQATNDGSGNDVEKRGHDAKSTSTIAITSTNTTEGEASGNLDTGESSAPAEGNESPLLLLHRAALEVLRDIEHPNSKNATARTLEWKYLARDEDAAMLDASVKGLAWERRMEVVAAALIEYGDQATEWNANRFSTFVRKVRNRPRAGTEAAAVLTKGEPGTGGYKPSQTYTEDEPTELTKIDARALLESFGVSAPRGEA